jgi:hypothetical protein
VIAQQFTGRDVRDAEVRGDQLTLSSLARARRRNHQYPHPASSPRHHRARPRQVSIRPLDCLQKQNWRFREWFLSEGLFRMVTVHPDQEQRTADTCPGGTHQPPLFSVDGHLRSPVAFLRL